MAIGEDDSAARGNPSRRHSLHVAPIWEVFSSSQSPTLTRFLGWSHSPAILLLSPVWDLQDPRKVSCFSTVGCLRCYYFLAGLSRFHRSGLSPGGDD
jgi:hypothetical protein